MTDKSVDKDKVVDRAYLVGIREPGVDEREATAHLEELAELVDTMGLTVVGSEMVQLKAPQPRLLIGSGKADEILAAAKAAEAQCVVIDFDLSPSQQRNWEKLGGLCVIDRQEVILDIFAARASTREAVLQVGLARMEYSLPRLTRAWTHLSRQRGGAKGTRGEGEKQLEADRRLALNRIDVLKAELKEVQQRRDTQRSRREKTQIPVIAIVGYTNVGKSSLLKNLTAAEVLVEDKLFATLDPTTRMIQLPSKQKVLLSDTVGFIRKLPHKLVAAFKSTLEEAALADLVIHVLDATSEHIEAQWRTTMDLLEELCPGGKPTVTVYNKSDLLGDPVLKATLRAARPDALFISARSGEGLDALVAVIEERINEGNPVVKLRLPHARYDVVAELYQRAKVVSAKHEDDDTVVTARIPEKHMKAFAKFIVPN